VKYVGTVTHAGGAAATPAHRSGDIASGRPGPRYESTSRRRVARTLLEHGPSTVAALAERLGVTPAAIRRHLDALLADGVVRTQDQRSYGPRTRGRPAKLFVLTDSGRDSFEAAYDDLAASALRFLSDAGGEDLVTAFARQRVAELETRYRALVDTSADRSEALALALSADGYAAELRPVPGGSAQLCQHHCPVAHVAEQFPQLCEAETEAFSRLLGTHVQRLATIAHGDGVCTTHIPALSNLRPTSTSGRTNS